MIGSFVRYGLMLRRRDAHCRRIAFSQSVPEATATSVGSSRMKANLAPVHTTKGSEIVTTRSPLHRLATVLKVLAPIILIGAVRT